MSRLFLTDIGINNSAGASPGEVYQNIFVEPTISSEEYVLISGRTTQVRRVSAELPMIPLKFKRFESRNNRLLLQAVGQIKVSIDRLIEKYGKSRVAIVLGTSTSGILESENIFIQNRENLLPSQLDYNKQEISSPSEFLADYLGLNGIHYTVSTACTSSAKVFIEGKRLIEADLCDAVILGGVDTLSSLTLDGFDALDSVSPQQTNPFSQKRNGINIGEGAAIFILSKEAGQVELLGYGESSDAYHISSPDPAGVGAEKALRAALAMSDVKACDVAYINLHGTGTPKNDFMESWVTHRVFGSKTPVSGTKPFIGHTLGAAGAQEAALCYLALSNINPTGRLPVHLWDNVQDEELPQLHFVTATDRLESPFCMSNSFAFGGSNVSLLFGRSK